MFCRKMRKYVLKMDNGYDREDYQTYDDEKAGEKAFAMSFCVTAQT